MKRQNLITITALFAVTVFAIAAHAESQASCCLNAPATEQAAVSAPDDADSYAALQCQVDCDMARIFSEDAVQVSGDNCTIGCGGDCVGNCTHFSGDTDQAAAQRAQAALEDLTNHLCVE